MIIKKDIHNGAGFFGVLLDDCVMANEATVLRKSVIFKRKMGLRSGYKFGKILLYLGKKLKKIKKREHFAAFAHLYVQKVSKIL